MGDAGVGDGGMVGVGVGAAVMGAAVVAVVVSVGAGAAVRSMSTAHPTNSKPSPAVTTKRISSNLVRGIGLLSASC